MSPSKPEFVLVPGGWHDPESFNPITTILTKAGYTCHGVHLPTVGASPPFKSSEPDVQAVKNTVERVLSTGKDVILIMHSYGGTVGCEALGPYLDELKFGKEGSGRVVRLIFCSAFVLPEGGSLMKALQMKPLPWFIINVGLPDSHSFLSSFFTLVGCHGVHVTAGLLWLGTMMAQFYAKGFRRDIRHRFLCFSLFWHALDIIWVGIFSLVYLVGTLPPELLP